MLKAIKGQETLTEMKTVLSAYSAEVSDTEIEAKLPTFRVIIGGNSDQVKCFNNILDKIKSLNEHEQCLIGEVVTLCKIMLVIPATSATTERSFPTARHLKMWLGSHIVQSRFNDVCILNTHKKRLYDLSLIDIASQFIPLKCK